MPPELDAAVRLLFDEREIRALVHEFARGLDDKDWAAYAGTFAEDGTFEIMGQARTGRAEIAAGPARDLTRYAALQHFVANVSVAVDGDRAEGRWYLFGIHVPDAGARASHADIGGCYRFSCRRTAEGWRFSAVALEIRWTGGGVFAVEQNERGAA